MSEKMVADVRTRLNLLIETDEGAEPAPGPIESFDDMVRPPASLALCAALRSAPSRHTTPRAAYLQPASSTARPSRTGV